MSPSKVLIVDDEPLARSSIRRLLRHDTDVQIVGEAADGSAAKQLIRATRPDIVFLDVQMPELSGVELVAGLEPAERPIIIFTTAYNSYAIEAFNLHAVDYLMKPYKDARFHEALERAKARLGRREVSEIVSEIDQVLTALSTGGRAGDSHDGDAPHARLVVKVNGDFMFINQSDIRWIEGHGDYLKMHCRSSAPLVRDTFKELLPRLDSVRFVRVHKSTVVNTDFVRCMRPASSGDYELELEDGTHLRVSRLYKAVLGKFL